MRSPTTSAKLALYLLTAVLSFTCAAIPAVSHGLGLRPHVDASFSATIVAAIWSSAMALAHTVAIPSSPASSSSPHSSPPQSNHPSTPTAIARAVTARRSSRVAQVGVNAALLLWHHALVLPVMWVKFYGIPGLAMLYGATAWAVSVALVALVAVLAAGWEGEEEKFVYEEVARQEVM